MTEPDEPVFFDDEELMRLFMELHSGNPREGPGDNESTLRALSMLSSLPNRPEILDVACGPGMQTIALANATGGHITALDLFQQFLDQVERSMIMNGVQNQITLMKGDMKKLPFNDESFDLIWSEGAIYIMGFENGLREWKRFLRPGGAIAVSQISWLREDIPKEIHDWWMDNCPDIRQIDENLSIIETLGYEVLGHFTLPESCWWDGYYESLIKGLEVMREKYPGNKKVGDFIRMEEEEMVMYRKYSEYYGYEFYVIRKP